MRFTGRLLVLELDVKRLVARHLGKTSERVPTNQLALLLDLLAKSEPMPDTIPPPAVELPEATKPKKERKGHGRSKLPEHLPRVEVEHRVPDGERACPSCGGERACIGAETSEVLDFVRRPSASSCTTARSSPAARARSTSRRRPRPTR